MNCKEENNLKKINDSTRHLYLHTQNGYAVVIRIYTVVALFQLLRGHLCTDTFYPLATFFFGFYHRQRLHFYLALRDLIKKKKTGTE